MPFLAAQVCHLAKQNSAVAVATLPDPLLRLPNHHPTGRTAINRQGLMEDTVIQTLLQTVQSSVVTHTKRPFSIAHLFLLALIRQIL